MKYRRDFEEIIDLKKPPQNVVVAEFNSDKKRKGSEKLYPSFSVLAGKVFAEDLINYAKAGGNMENLNAGDVYGLLNNEIKNN